jgi:hypothetical protein
MRAMLRRLTLAAATLLFGLLAAPRSADAQVLIMLFLGDKIVTEKFQPGISFSFVGSGFWGYENRMRLSWSAGLFGEVRLTDRLSLQPEFLFKSPGGAQKLDTSVPAYPFKPVGEPTLDDVIQNGKVTRELRSVAFPVLLKYWIKMVAVGAGPVFSIVTRATDTVTAKVGGKEIDVTQSIENKMRNYDVGVTASVECAFSRDDPVHSMRARLKGVLGLVDTVENNPDAIRNWAIYAGIDIPIGSPPQKKPPATKPSPARESKAAPGSEPETRATTQPAVQEAKAPE